MNDPPRFDFALLLCTVALLLDMVSDSGVWQVLTRSIGAVLAVLAAVICVYEIWKGTR